MRHLSIAVLILLPAIGCSGGSAAGEVPTDVGAVASTTSSSDAPDVPEGRPVVGRPVPEIEAAGWINRAAPATLADLRGQVVLVEFWATWCGPCVKAIPHLNDVYGKYRGEGLEMLALTDEKRGKVEQFLSKRPIDYPVGVGSNSFVRYRVTGIPKAFLIGRDGTLLWEGHSGSPALEPMIRKALKG